MKHFDLWIILQTEGHKSIPLQTLKWKVAFIPRNFLEILYRVFYAFSHVNFLRSRWKTTKKVIFQKLFWILKLKTWMRSIQHLRWFHYPTSSAMINIFQHLLWFLKYRLPILILNSYVDFHYLVFNQVKRAVVKTPWRPGKRNDETNGVKPASPVWYKKWN